MVQQWLVASSLRLMGIAAALLMLVPATGHQVEVHHRGRIQELQTTTQERLLRRDQPEAAKLKRAAGEASRFMRRHAKSAAGDEIGDCHAVPARPDAMPAASGIPSRLIVTGRGPFEHLPAQARANILKSLASNPGLQLRYLSDEDCIQYLQEHFDDKLVSHYEHEKTGSMRGDICRAAVLFKEGGFYHDLDLDLEVPLHQLVDNSTTFMSVYELPNDKGGILNALIATVPDSTIMNNTLVEIRRWYHEKHKGIKMETYGWMGPMTLAWAVEGAVKESCPRCGRDLWAVKARMKNREQWSCGPHVMRFYYQRYHDCRRGECPPVRRDSKFVLLRYALHRNTRKRQRIGWARLEACDDPGCGFGGWSKVSLMDGINATAQRSQAVMDKPAL